MRRDVGGWALRWDADRAAAAVRSGAWKNVTVASAAAELLARAPERILVIEGERGFAVREIHAAAERLARALLRRGLAPGDTISFQLPNWHEAMIVSLAAVMAGLVLNPITPIYRDAEVGFMLADSRSKLIFVPAEFRGYDFPAMMRRVLPGLGAPVEVVVLRGDAGDFTSWDALMALGEDGGELPLPGADPDAVKLVMYTSGTTGRAKGVIHSHNSLHAENWMRAAHLGIGPADILFNPSPVTHVTGMLYALCLPFTLGVTTILMDVWNASEALASMRRHGATGMIASTIFLQELLAAAQAQEEHLPCLRFFLCGGAQVRPELILDAGAHFTSCAFSRIYGSTEVPMITAGVASRDRAALGADTDGQIFGTEARVVDAASGAPVAEGTEGEIVARGPQMFLGYTRAEDNTDAFDADGFFRMGDLGRIVHDDFIVITGRKKDLIIRAGENISAKEVEDLLLGHPAVADVAIVAMPNARTGEMACAFVIPRAGQTIDLAEITRFLIAAGLAKQKIPEHLERVDDLPRTAIGKVRKDVLRATARDIAAAASAA
jgi:acyl-CoA synthetase (AMP-forming)/AMP-acid ligase II